MPANKQDARDFLGLVQAKAVKAVMDRFVPRYKSAFDEYMRENPAIEEELRYYDFAVKRIIDIEANVVERLATDSGQTLYGVRSGVHKDDRTIVHKLFHSGYAPKGTRMARILDERKAAVGAVNSQYRTIDNELKKLHTGKQCIKTLKGYGFDTAYLENMIDDAPEVDKSLLFPCGERK